MTETELDELMAGGPEAMRADAEKHFDGSRSSLHQREMEVRLAVAQKRMLPALQQVFDEIAKECGGEHKVTVSFPEGGTP